MVVNRMQFLLFYSIFLVFVVYITGLAAFDILEAPGIGDLPLPTGNILLDWTLPFVFFIAFLSVSSEFLIIFTLILTPFIIGLALLIAEMIRGN